MGQGARKGGVWVRETHHDEQVAEVAQHFHKVLILIESPAGINANVNFDQITMHEMQSNL